MMIFDIMPQAGASQVHPHVQGFLGKNTYLGKMGKLDQAINLYRNRTKQNYLEDYINVHIALGLGLRYRTASIVVPLDSQKDNEFVIVGTSSLRDWTRLLYLVHRTYIEELKVYCFSTGMAWPTSILFRSSDLKISKIGKDLKGSEELSDSPNSKKVKRTIPKTLKPAGSLMFARVGSRGNCQSVESDVSSLELYLINHLSTDPYVTISALKRILKKYG